MTILKGYWQDFRGRTTNWDRFSEPTRDLHVCQHCATDLPLKPAGHRRQRNPNGSYERVAVYSCRCGHDRWVKTGRAA